MEREIHCLPFLWVEEIATSESESSFAFPRRLGSPRSDASASFPEMELGEENIGSRLVDLPHAMYSMILFSQLLRSLERIVLFASGPSTAVKSDKDGSDLYKREDYS